MYIRDMTPQGPTITPRLPSYGIYNNILLGDKRRGVEPAAVSPMGKLTMTSDDNVFTLLEGVSPAMFLPMDQRSNLRTNQESMEAEEKVDNDFAQDWREMDRLLDEILDPGWSWDIHPLDPTYRTANLPTKAFHAPKEQHIVRDYLYRYQLWNMADYKWWLTELQDNITRFRLKNSSIETKPIGMTLLLDDTSDSKRTMIRPRDHVVLRDKVAMRMMVPREDYIMRHKREGYKWQLMVAVAAEHVSRLIGKRKWDLTREDYLAWSAYTIGAYAGYNTTIDDQVRYTAEDVLQDTLSYLSLPFADAWPDISLADAQDQKVKDQLKWVWMLNTALSVAGKRVGGKVVPVQYMLEAGNVHLVKSILPMYLKSPLSAGGGDVMWMPPAVNTSAPYGVFFPSAVYYGTNRWEPNIEEKYDAFSDMVCDRGRMNIPELDSLKSNFRVVMSRDSLVRTMTERGIQYGALVHKIQPNGFRREMSCAEEFLLSYIADPTMKFGPCVFVSSALGRTRHDITLGPTPLYDSGKLKPMPGGLVDTDAGTMHALAQPTAAQSVGEAESRSTAKVVTPTVTGDVAIVETASQDSIKKK